MRSSADAELAEVGWVVAVLADIEDERAVEAAFVA